MNKAANPRITMPEDQSEPQLRVVSGTDPSETMIPSGINALDARTGGLEKGGVYLVSGTPGPAKLVAALQFLHAGISRSERVLFLTDMNPADALEVSRAWGSNLDRAWEEGKLEILGFRDDFEMRVLRSTEPEDVLVELHRLVSPEVSRIAVDPGSLFLQGGGRSLVGRSFLDWARRHPSTFCVTLSIDNDESLPSSAEWLVHATDGVFLLDRQPDGLFQVLIHRSLPGTPDSPDPITLRLAPGVGLGKPDRVPARRYSDRPAGDADTLLLLSLGENSGSDLEVWAGGTFKTEVLSQPLEAVSRLQGGTPFGCVLVHSPRTSLKEAAQACRAMRPLTAAAIVFASDDAIRSTDRVSLLEAGADDCLSGGVDFRELTTRISQAVAAGGKPAAPMEAVRHDAGLSAGGRVSPDVFRAEAERRASHQPHSNFAILRLGSPTVAQPELDQALGSEIRGEEGDLVACTPDGCFALLQGARWESAQAFLARFRNRLDARLGRDSALRADVMIHPADKDQVSATLARLRESGSTPNSRRDPGGEGGQDA